MKICIISIHGHIKGETPPIGGHPDTGGQIVYVLNLVKYLSSHGYEVDLFTRKFKSEKWDGFDKKIEQISDNSRIIRLAAGPDEFVSKEDLWPYLNEFAENIKTFYQEDGTTCDIINTHYGDSGVVGAILKSKINKPLVHFGHSLAAVKLASSGISQSNFLSVNKKFSFHTRIFSERTTFDWSDLIVVNTEDEIYQQYGDKIYDGAIAVEDSRFFILPPAIDTTMFYSPFKGKKTAKIDKDADLVLKNIMENSIDPSRRGLPAVLMVARLDKRKNILGLIEAYASNKELQKIANLFISAGNLIDPTSVKNWDGMHTNYKNLLKDIRKIIVKNALQGKIILTDILDHDNIYPGILRHAVRNNWVFADASTHEHRGIAILEAMASGLPVVATNVGTTEELLGMEDLAILLDPNDSIQMGETLYEILTNHEEWEKMSTEGAKLIEERFSWKDIGKKLSSKLKELKKISKKEMPKYKLVVPRFIRQPNDKSEKDLIDDLRTFLFDVSSGKRQASKVARDLAGIIIGKTKTESYDRPLLFMMTGATGTGKTTIANKLSRTLNNQGYQSLVIRTEDYIKDLPKELIAQRLKASDISKVYGPQEMNMDQLIDHIKKILKGEEVISPVVNLKANSRKMRTISKEQGLKVLILETQYPDYFKGLDDLLLFFDMDMEQVREQRFKKDDVALYPKTEEAKILIDNMVKIECEYLKKTKIKNNADLKLNNRYEIYYRLEPQARVEL